MQARYERNVPALSEAECALLGSKRVAVIGCGGLGGHIIELLARVGVGYIKAVDGDSFDESNLNRQLLSETALIGKSKAQAAKERVQRINPDVEVTAVEAFLTEENALDIVSGCDVVMDALDNVSARRVLSRACEMAGIPYVYGAISGWVAQCAVSMPGDGLIEKLFGAEPEITDKSVLSFTPALCAAAQCALCVKLLCGRDVQSGQIYYFDLLNMEFENISII
ncbi:MAG: HesA/MoeB/ThiF family protein [Oscillospiraceae bacterium]|nr:HesA/MoeB/ThiF family protein [Oscillospiraceae bacterium]